MRALRGLGHGAAGRGDRAARRRQRPDLDRVDHLTFADSHTVAGVSRAESARPQGHGRAHGRDVRRRRAWLARLPGAPAARHGDQRDRRRARAAPRRAADPAAGARGRRRDHVSACATAKRRVELKTTLMSDRRQGPCDHRRARRARRPAPRAASGHRHDLAARARPRPLGRARLHARGLRRSDRPPAREGAQIAVTGTIDLDGDVGPIGGVRQKVIGAARARADIVLVPVPNAAMPARRPRDAFASSPAPTFRAALAALGESTPAT